MNWHILAVWACFIVGELSYWFKRAYYGINPPNPIATSYSDWIRRSWPPLLVRFLLEAAAFWLLFTPGLADKGLAAIGWESYEWAVVAVTQFPPLAFFLGHTMDSIADMAISKIPLLNQILPQMPGPLPQPAVVEAQVVKQTTEVTQLQTKTTVVNPEGK